MENEEDDNFEVKKSQHVIWDLIQSKVYSFE